MTDDTDITEVLQKLRRLRERIIPEPYERKHYSRLTDAINGLDEEIDGQSAHAGRLEMARQSWSDHAAHGSEVSEANIKRLCWAPEIANLPEFCAELSRSGPLLGRALRGLIASYHEKWEGELSPVENLLRKGLMELRNGRGAALKWKNEASALIGTNAPSLFASDARSLGVSITARLKSLSLSATSAFARKSAECLVNVAQAEVLGADFHRYLTEIVLPEDNELLAPKVWGKVYEVLVRTQTGPVDEGARTQVLDLALGTRNLADPRINRNEWENVPGKAIDTVIQWLSREDLRFFFDLLMGNQEDRQKRHPFWIEYADGALRSRVVVGEDDQRRVGAQLEELRARGRSYATMTGAGATNSGASAFIMDFGKITIVEMSKPNSACYFFTNTGEVNHIDIAAHSYRWRDLKDTAEGEYYAHGWQWQETFREILAQYGIRPKRA